MIQRYKSQRLARKTRTRKRLRARSKRPRLSVFRSNEHIYAQIIDDEKGVTVVAASDLEMIKMDTMTKREKANVVGLRLAQEAKKAGVTTVVLDRGPYQYGGRVQALAEAARKGGLKV